MNQTMPPLSAAAAQAASMEAQLVDLYRGVDLLQTELGVSDPEDVVAMIRSLEAQVEDMAVAEQLESLELQLVDLYRRKEFLDRELGVSDPEAIVAKVRGLEQQLVGFYRNRDAALTA